MVYFWPRYASRKRQSQPLHTFLTSCSPGLDVICVTVLMCVRVCVCVCVYVRLWTHLWWVLEKIGRLFWMTGCLSLWMFGPLRPELLKQFNSPAIFFIYFGQPTFMNYQPYGIWGCYGLVKVGNVLGTRCACCMAFSTCVINSLSLMLNVHFTPINTFLSICFCIF